MSQAMWDRLVEVVLITFAGVLTALLITVMHL